MMSESSVMTNFGPVRPEERLVIIDVLRGFALLGIAIMNMAYFNSPMSADSLEPRLFPAAYDRAAEVFMTVFFAGKANSIFSLLFGVGLTIQMQRAEAKGQDVARMHWRRLGILFLIGAVHAIFIWDGDVLHNYAVMGIVLWALRRSSNRTLFSVIALSLAIPLGYLVYSTLANIPQSPSVAELAQLARDDMRIFQQGTYWEQVGARVWHLKLSYVDMGMRGLGQPLWYFMLTTTMVMGLYAGREKILSNIEANRERIRRITGWCLAIGLASALVAGILTLFHKPDDSLTPVSFLMAFLYTVNRPMLCIAYVGVLALLLLRPGSQRVLSWLGPAGRMPLTNYLMQSILATTLFNSYGFALFGRVGPLLGLGISIALFVLQVLYSHAWMRRFQYGPLEWFWRYAAYGQAPPMRRSAA